MTYKHNWRRSEKETIFGKEYTIDIAVSTYGKPISDKERSAYQKFTENKSKYYNMAAKQLMKYIDDNFVDLADTWSDARSIKTIKDLTQVVTPKTLLVDYNGNVVLLLDCEWDTEHGMGVQFIPKISTGPQDLFL